MKFSVMCVLVPLCCVYGSLVDELVRISQVCCSEGTAYGRQHSSEDCSSSSSPSVPPHLRQLCVLSMDQCCKEYIQNKKDCDTGVDIATRTQRCDGTIGSAQTCCNECKRGMDAGDRGEGCTTPTGNSQDELLTGDAFQKCCVKMVDKKQRIKILNQTMGSSSGSTSGDDPFRSVSNHRPNRLFRSRIRCEPGYFLNPNTDQCEDVNECVNGQTNCKGVEICVNTNGGYRCDCPPNWVLDSVTESCVPGRNRQILPLGYENETHASPTSTTKTIITALTSTTSTQTPDLQFGRFRPNWLFRPRRQCHSGYYLNHITDKCEDIDECATDSHNCFKTETCRNTMGAYACDCRVGYRREVATSPCTAINAIRTTSTILSTTITTLASTTSTSTTAPDYPFLNRDPNWTSGSGTKCGWGYYLSRITEKCEDINECELGESNCGPTQICSNFPGGYQCSCPSGYSLIDNHDCADIDECNHPICSSNADCVNTIGSYKCQCHTGFRLAPVNNKICVDVDECLETEHLCDQRCNNIWGGYRCSCHRGYKLSKDNRTCSDMDECTEVKSKLLCIGRCVNDPGSYHCQCPSGYTLSGDKRSCVDINECETGAAPCASSTEYNSISDVCLNTRGSYKCYRISCANGYKLEKKNRCTKIDRTCPPEDWNCAHQPTTYSYNFITFVSQLYMPNGKVDLFTMRGPTWENSRLKFELRLVDANAPPSVKDKGDIDAFLLTQTNATAVVSLVRSLPGPQTIELELSMELYVGDVFGGVAAAKLFIVVSEYEF